MERKKHLILSSFVLKIIAMVAMVADHITFIFLNGDNPLYLPLRLIGRLAFVLFAFFISEGAHHSKNKDKYLIRLSILYVITQIGIIAANIFDQYLILQNIFLTLIAGVGVLTYIDKKEWKKVYYLMPAIIATLFYLLYRYGSFSFLAIWVGDYGIYGIVVILGFSLARYLIEKLWARYPLVKEDDYSEESNDIYETNHQSILNTAYSTALLIITFIFYVLDLFNLTTLEFGPQSYSLFVIPLILLYNGKLGHNGKVWRKVYYSFYPVHLILLFVLLLILI